MQRIIFFNQVCVKPILFTASWQQLAYQLFQKNYKPGNSGSISNSGASVPLVPYQAAVQAQIKSFIIILWKRAFRKRKKNGGMAAQGIFITEKGLLI